MTEDQEQIEKWLKKNKAKKPKFGVSGKPRPKIVINTPSLTKSQRKKIMEKKHNPFNAPKY